MMRGLSTKERFYSKFNVNEDNGCWEWIANKLPKGYGRFKENDTSKVAHRVSYEMHIGHIKEGMIICHHCDNPPCVNPFHLFMGTHKDNVIDKKSKGRDIIGEKNGRSKLTEKDIPVIRRLLASKIRQVDIAKQFGLANRTISAINTGHTWTHIKEDK
jgi:hypothetical protein